MAASSKGSSQVPIVFCFEFEHGIFNGRKIMFDAAKKVLHDKEISLTPVLFSRFCLHPMPSVFAPALLKYFDKKLSAEKVAREIDEEYRSMMAGKKPVANGKVVEFINQATKAQHRAAAFTFLDDAMAQALVDRAGITALSLLPLKRIGATVPSADTWMRLVKSTEVDPKQCLLFVTSGVSCRSAMVAGMHCIAMPDELTNFQDFAGANISLESEQALSLPAFLEIMRPLSAKQAAS